MEKFEMFLVVRVGLMPCTIRGYIGAVKRIIKVVGENPDVYTLEKYVNQLYTSELSYHHKLNTVLAVERYMEFLGRPIKFARQRKPKPIIKNTLSEAEVTKLIFSCKTSREKALVSILAYSGIRNQELCDLKVLDVLLTQNAIRVLKGKGIKDGISEIAPECSYTIMQYLSDFPRGSDEYLFTTLVKNNKMATADIRKIVKVISKRAKIEKRVYPHLLRHSLTANMLLRGADIISLKNQLRHSWLETTLHYANSIVFVQKNLY